MDSAYALARSAQSEGDFERSEIVMMRELRTSSSSEFARTPRTSSSVAVEAGREVLYCCTTFVKSFSDRQSELRVLNIST